MRRKLKGDEGQRDCPNCGGIHFGARFDDCPFIKAPCVVCGADTIYACSDCQIDYGKSVHICGNNNCQREHENLHPDKKPQDLMPEIVERGRVSGTKKGGGK